MFRIEDLPQADVLDYVISTVEAVAKGARTFQQIAKAIGKVDRQGRYYRLAAEQLGLIQTVSTNYSKLTKKGEKYIAIIDRDMRKLYLTNCALENTAIYATYTFIKNRGQCSREDIIDFLINKGVSYSVSKRRVTTLAKWLVDLSLITINNNVYVAIENNIEKEPDKLIDNKYRKKNMIPEFLHVKKIPSHPNNPLHKVAQIYHWRTFVDITEEDLKQIRLHQYNQFWDVIRCLSFHGVDFPNKKLNRFQFNNSSNQYILYTDEDERIDYEGKYAFLKLRLRPYQIYFKSDLHLTPVDHLELQDYTIESALDFLKKEGFIITFINGVTQNINYTTKQMMMSSSIAKNKKKIQFNSTIIELSAEYQKAINIDNFPSTPKLVEHLNNHQYFDVQDLPEDLTFMCAFPSIGEVAVRKFINHLGNEVKFRTELVTDLLPPKKLGNIITIKDKGYIEIENQNYIIPKSYWAEQVHFSALYKLFKQFDIKQIGEIPVKIENFLQMNKVPKRLQKQWPDLFFNQLPLELQIQLFRENLCSFQKNDKPNKINERNWLILLKRSEGLTLEEIAIPLSLTRERIRQIIIKEIKGMYRKFESVFKYIEEQVDRLCFVHVFDLIPGSTNETLKGWKLLENVNLKFVISGPLVLSSSEFELDIATEEWFSNFMEGRDITILLSKDEIEDALCKTFSKTQEATFNYVLDLVLDSCFTYEVKENRYRCKQRLSKAEMCLAVFEKEFPNGLEVYKEGALFKEKVIQHFSRQFENDSERGIIANLLRMEQDIILWDSGYYMPISKVLPLVQLDVLNNIKSWFEKKIREENVHQLSTRIAFPVFDDQLKSMQIASPHALFSVLKRVYPEAFNYAHSPTLVQKGFERFEQSQMLEQFVNNYNDYVPHDILKAHFVDSLGWTNVAYEQQIVYNDGRLIKAKDQSVIHIDNLEIHQDLMQSIIRYVKGKLDKAKSISVDVIFEEKQSAMHHMNIKDSRVLYEILKNYYEEKIEMPRYPHIQLIGEQDATTVTSSKQMELFLLENEYSLLREEVREEFIEKRGWKPASLHAAYQSNKRNIVQIYNDEFIHVNHLNWTDEKQEFLKERILVRWEEVYPDEVFVDVEKHLFKADFIEILPELANGYDWSEILLTSFMDIMDDTFICIGNKRRKRLFVKKDNPYGINADPDFITYLLKYRFPGYVNKSDLAAYLNQIAFSKTRIPANCYPSEETTIAYFEDNDEFILHEMTV